MVCVENTHWIYSNVYALLTSSQTQSYKKNCPGYSCQNQHACFRKWRQVKIESDRSKCSANDTTNGISFAMREVDYFEMICLCLCQAWEPLHSSEGFALAGSGRHSWGTQSWSLAAAGRLSQQPWPTWTLPHPNYQGNIGGGAECCHDLLLLYDTRREACSLTQVNMLPCILSRLGLFTKVCVWFTHT